MILSRFRHMELSIPLTLYFTSILDISQVAFVSINAKSRRFLWLESMRDEKIGMEIAFS